MLPINLNTESRHEAIGKREPRAGKQTAPPIYDLIDMTVPTVVHDEVKSLLCLIHPAFDSQRLDRAFEIVVKLFRGEHPDFRACNTGFHDLKHTTDVYLAMARMLHGVVLDGARLSVDELTLAQITALFHDIGYLQDRLDHRGTGAKHTQVHERRSTNILSMVQEHIGLTDDEINRAGEIIDCTNLALKIDEIQFSNARNRYLGKLLATVDLLAQTAERTYLEKLLYLFHEFREGKITGYRDELDLLNKTDKFLDSMEKRLADDLDGYNRHMRAHFRERWNIDEDLYQTAIDRQRLYLKTILADDSCDPRDYLKRDAIVTKVRERFGDDE